MIPTTRKMLEDVYVDWIGVMDREDLNSIASEDMIVHLLCDIYERLEDKADTDHSHHIS